MAIIDARDDYYEDSPASALGGLIALGANFIPGASFLTPFGLGLQGLGAAQSGDTQGMNDAFNAIKTGNWKKKKSKTQTTVAPTGTQQTDAELAQKWSPYHPYFQPNWRWW